MGDEHGNLGAVLGGEEHLLGFHVGEVEGGLGLLVYSALAGFDVPVIHSSWSGEGGV